MLPWHVWVDPPHLLQTLSNIMNAQLDMLMSREQLMEDINCIVDDFFYSNYNGDVSEAEKLVMLLSDAVCKNFPTN